jgi:Protein of unknown function DUF131.
MNYDVLVIIVSLFIILLGFFLLVVFSLSRSSKADIKAGGFILIGPIPIVFSNDKRLGYILIITGIVLTILAILLFLIPLLR